MKLQCIGFHTVINRLSFFHIYFSANTHLHADHITGTGELKKRVNGCFSIISEASEAKADVKIKHGDLIKFGRFALEALSTPGHTNGTSPQCFFLLLLVMTLLQWLGV